MSLAEKIEPTPVKNIGLIISLWIVGLVGWTLFLLFGIPFLQKQFLVEKSTDFLNFETTFGAFTIIGYFSFMLLLILQLIIILSPPETGTKGIGILLIILAVFILAGIAESILGYKYISAEKLAVRSIFAPVEKQYKWNDVEKVKVSFILHTGSTKGTNISFLKWQMILKDKNSISIENAVQSDFTLMKKIYKLIPETSNYEVDEKNKDYWEEIKRTIFESL